MFYFKLILILIWLVISSTLSLIYAVFRWGNTSVNRDFGRLYAWGVLGILGVKVQAEGVEYLEASQPCIYVSNHQSNMDMATFGTIYPRRTILIGKKELLFIPFFGIFFAAAGNITIDRKKSVKAVAGLSQACDVVKKRKVSIWIFPEGTRNKKGEGLLPFKRGAFHVACQAGVPIVPIVSAPLSPLMSWKKRILKPGVVKVKILPPISTVGIKESEIDALSKRVRSEMLEALHGLIPQGGRLNVQPSLGSSSLKL